MTKLSVNINKLATLRNSRGGNNPNLVKMAIDAQLFGADGITIHPRPDERHIRYKDAFDLKEIITTEYNIEGNPTEDKFMQLVLAIKPTQVTLVPDALVQLTSNHGWDCITHKDYLIKTIALFKNAGIRTSIFVDALPKQIDAAFGTGTDRIELYTESYATYFKQNKVAAVAPYAMACAQAATLGMGVNAGHDLDLQNLHFFAKNLAPHLLEVSIGHALICDSIYLGFENAIQMYKRQLSL